MRCINCGVVSSLSSSSFKQDVFLLKRKNFFIFLSLVCPRCRSEDKTDKDSTVQNIPELAANTHDDSNKIPLGLCYAETSWRIE